MNIRELINQAAERAAKRSSEETLRKMKMAGLTKERGEVAIKKLERLLFDYPKFITVDGSRKKTTRTILEIERSLAKIKSDPFYSVIELYYFQRMSMEDIAGTLEVNTATVSRNKRRLLREIAPFIFSDEYIEDILFK